MAPLQHKRLTAFIQTCSVCEECTTGASLVSEKPSVMRSASRGGSLHKNNTIINDRSTRTLYHNDIPNDTQNPHLKIFVMLKVFVNLRQYGWDQSMNK